MRSTSVSSIRMSEQRLMICYKCNDPLSHFLGAHRFADAWRLVPPLFCVALPLFCGVWFFRNHDLAARKSAILSALGIFFSSLSMSSTHLANSFPKAFQLFCGMWCTVTPEINHIQCHRSLWATSFCTTTAGRTCIARRWWSISTGRSTRRAIPSRSAPRTIA